MQFSAIVIATVLAALAPSASAATCYSASGCKTCESQTSLYDARQAFCGSSDWQGTSFMGWGYAQVNLEGSFYSQQECFDGFANIIVQCLGHKDGGIYTYNYGGHDARLDVDFCSCE